MEQVNYSEILRKFKDAQEKLHYTNKQIATLTDTASGTFSRYWNEKTRMPLEFIARAEKVLGVNVLGPAQADKIPEEQIAKETAQAIADKLNAKNEKIDELQTRIDELQGMLIERERTIQTLVEVQAQLVRMLGEK